jgi:hypothetical protein
MSYPSAPGTGTNLGCDTSLQRNQDTFLFQLNPGGGGSSENNLQSPAAIIPDSAGAASLSLNTTGTGSAVIQLNAAGGLPTKNAVRFSDPTANGIALYQDANVSGGLQIGNDNALVNIAVFNNASNSVTLGRTATAGSVNLNAATIIKTSAGVNNSLTLAPTSATQSLISQTVATNGVVQVGSSVSNPNVLEVADVAGNGGVYIRSTAADLPLVLSSTTAAGSSVVNGVPSAGRLTIGSSAANPSAILIVDSTTSVTNLALDTTPQVLLPSGTYAPGSITVFAGPVGVGLYAIMGCSTAPGNTGTTIASQISTFAYVNASGGIQMGGAAYTQLGSTEYVAILPDPTNVQNLELAITGGVGSQSLVNYSIVAVRLSKGIAGMF